MTVVTSWNDIGSIDVGFLVRDSVVVDAVTQLGRLQINSFDGSLLNDRPPLLLEGRQIANGSDFPFAVMAIHGRSLNNVDARRDLVGPDDSDGEPGSFSEICKNAG